MSKTMMAVALLAALGLVAYVAVIQPAAAAPAATGAADADEDGGILGWLFGDESPWDTDSPSGPDAGPAYSV